MAHNISGKIALVFGAGSTAEGWSNGKAAAVTYARHGAFVFAIDIDFNAAKATSDFIASEGFTCTPYCADVTSQQAVMSVVDAAMTQYGRIDILHNNVGITGNGGPIEMTEQEWHTVFNVNVNSVFLACKAVLPIMLAQQSGVIINISSLAAEQIVRYPYMAYNASKAAVNQLTRAIAVQYAAKGIRANAIMPGMMDTPLVYKQIAGKFEDLDTLVAQRNAAVPMGRMGDAWDVAKAALFLASDDASYITGVCLPVDGGKSCAGL